MRYVPVIIVFILATIQGCAPQNDTTSRKPQMKPKVQEEFNEYCKTHKCRKNLKVHLKKPDGSYFHSEMELAQPIVQGNLVSIFPGETIYIEFDPGLKGPENLRSVESTSDSKHILTFKFTQEDKLANGAGMMLFVHNPSNRHIKYDLEMQLIDSDDLFKTSCCPLRPEMRNYESWPHPIFQLVMTNFRWVDKSNLDCN
jgi:hypothetical protein